MTKTRRSRARSSSAVVMISAETRRGLQDEGSEVMVVVVVIIDRIVDEVTGSGLVNQCKDVGRVDPEA